MNADVIESIIQTHLPAAANGDQHAYSRIVHGCQNTVTSIALAIVRDVPASEDIAQEAFMSAWQQLKKLKNAGSFLPWLRQITRNLARDYLRAQKYRANPAGDIEAMMLSVADPAPGPSEFLAEQEDAKIAAAVIDALPEESREVLLLYYREGQNTHQVASLLGMQDAAVRKRLSRARQTIREELLQRTGNFVKASAPSLAFTTLVSSLLFAAAPSTATAGVLATTAGSSSIAGKGFFAILSAVANSILLGIGASILGIWSGLWPSLKNAHDQREKRELIIWGVVNTLLVGGFSIEIVVLCMQENVAAVILLTVGFTALLLFNTLYCVKHIFRRRMQHYQSIKPITISEITPKRLIYGWIGATVGGAAAIGCILWALWGQISV
ncbi:MAG: sigma-70 family RNA polymerase sigma factor [Arenimonas sp.]